MIVRALGRRTAVRLRATARAQRVALAVLVGAPLAVRLVSPSTEAVARAIVAVVVYGGLALPFCVALGGPASTAGRAAALLWLQKPRSPWSLHLAGLGPRLLAGGATVAAVSTGGAAVALVLGSNGALDRIGATVPALFLSVPVVVVVVHASSGIGLRPEPLMALLLLAGLVAPRLAMVVAPEAAAPWAGWIELLALPVDEIGNAARALRSSGRVGSDLLVIVRFCAIWSLVGVLAQARPSASHPGARSASS